MLLIMLVFRILRVILRCWWCWLSSYVSLLLLGTVRLRGPWVVFRGICLCEGPTRAMFLTIAPLRPREALFCTSALSGAAKGTVLRTRSVEGQQWFVFRGMPFSGPNEACVCEIVFPRAKRGNWETTPGPERAELPFRGPQRPCFGKLPLWGTGKVDYPQVWLVVSLSCTWVSHDIYIFSVVV